MKKRTTKIGTYDTAAHGWTLTGWELSAPDQKTNYVEKPGSDGSWDLSTSLSGGIPRYKDRSLTITLECSKGTRADRERIVDELVNTLDGFEWQITPPDKPDHYVTGRVHIAVEYSDLAHAAVTITATCAPWIYKARETIVELAATGAKQTTTLRNAGRLAVLPTIKVANSAVLEYEGTTLNITAGTHTRPALLLTPGLHSLTYSGSGRIELIYREAVLR